MLNSTNSEYCKTCICVNSALCVLNDLYFFSVMKVVKNIFKKHHHLEDRYAIL